MSFLYCLSSSGKMTRQSTVRFWSFDTKTLIMLAIAFLWISSTEAIWLRTLMVAFVKSSSVEVTIRSEGIDCKIRDSMRIIILGANSWVLCINFTNWRRLQVKSPSSLMANRIQATQKSWMSSGRILWMKRILSTSIKHISVVRDASFRLSAVSWIQFNTLLRLIFCSSLLRLFSRLRKWN